MDHVPVRFQPCPGWVEGHFLYVPDSVGASVVRAVTASVDVPTSAEIGAKAPAEFEGNDGSGVGAEEGEDSWEVAQGHSFLRHPLDYFF